MNEVIVLRSVIMKHTRGCERQRTTVTYMETKVSAFFSRMHAHKQTLCLGRGVGHSEKLTTQMCAWCWTKSADKYRGTMKRSGNNNTLASLCQDKSVTSSRQHHLVLCVNLKGNDANRRGITSNHGGSVHKEDATGFFTTQIDDTSICDISLCLSGTCNNDDDEDDASVKVKGGV